MRETANTPQVMKQTPNYSWLAEVIWGHHMPPASSCFQCHIQAATCRSHKWKINYFWPNQPEFGCCSHSVVDVGCLFIFLLRPVEGLSYSRVKGCNFPQCTQFLCSPLLPCNGSPLLSFYFPLSTNNFIW